MKKPKSGGDEGGNWMDTYGDMVTLLLCFFVMLYSMSNINQQKWEVFVRSIFPNSVEESQVTINTPVDEEGEDIQGSAEEHMPEEEEFDMDTLYLLLARRLEEIGVEGVTVSRGEDYTFIVFENQTFFDGESSVLTDEGEEVLDVFCEVISPAKDLLSQINIMGYTSQGDPTRPNNPRRDRMLSSERAAEVCIYIQLQEVIEPEKLISISYGQFRPVASFETAEGRAKNRRVELLMIDAGADIRALNDYYDEYQSGANSERTVVTGGGFVEAEPTPPVISTDVDTTEDIVRDDASGAEEDGAGSDTDS